VTSKGQITLPKEIRTKLGLRQGDRVRFVIEDDGRVRLLPAKRDISELVGSCPGRSEASRPEEIDEPSSSPSGDMYSAMIGIDTNVLLRVIIADEPKQAEAARNFIRETCSSDDPGYVSHITLVELVWTLAKAYQFSREDISRAVEQILETAQLDVESSNDVAAALKEYRKGPADFADCLLLGQCRRRLRLHDHVRPQGRQAGWLHALEGAVALRPRAPSHQESQVRCARMRAVDAIHCR